MTYNTYFKIVDAKISSVLLPVYGSELWGLDKFQVHHYACKRLACAPVNTCNTAIMGDCGRFLKIPEYRYVRKCYNMLKMLGAKGKINWVTSVRKFLFKNGFGNI